MNKFSCSTFKQGKYELVAFLCPAKKLFTFVKANQLEDDTESGYQRIVSPSRRKKIAQFIDSGNPLPLSILIALNGAKLSQEKTTLSIPDKADAGWIIDGQHRLAGAHDAEADIVFPVIAFLDISEEEQVFHFVTINREQTGVPSSLYYELLKRLPTRKTETELLAERATDIADTLRRDEESPFYARIVVTTAASDGKLSLTNFVRKVSPFLKRDNGFLFPYDDEDRCKIISNYYDAIRLQFSKEFNTTNSVFFKTVGFGALMNCLPLFFNLTIARSGSFRTKDARQMFGMIPEFDPARWKQMGSGNAAEKSAGEDLQTLLTQARDTGVLADKKLKLD